MKRLVTFFCLSLVISVFFAATAYGQNNFSVDQFEAYNWDTGITETFVRFQNGNGAAGDYNVTGSPSLDAYAWNYGGASNIGQMPVVSHLDGPIVLFRKNDILANGGTVTVTLEGYYNHIKFSGVWSSASKYVVTRGSTTDGGGTMDVVAGEAIRIIAQLSYADGKPISTPGKTVTWGSSYVGEFSSGEFSSSTSVTDENGMATVTFTTSTSAGADDFVTATDNDAFTGSSGVIHTIAGPPARLAFSQVTQRPIAGKPFDVTIQLQDKYGNPVEFNGAGVLALTLAQGRGILGGTLSAAVQGGSNTTTISGVTYSVAAKSDVFLKVTGSGSGNAGGLTGTSGELHFDATLTVTATNGTVAKDPDLGSYPCNAIVKLTATPAPGYQFANWSGDATGSDNPIDVEMDANKSVTANFASITSCTVTLSSNPSAGGTTSGGGTFNPGSSVTVTATPSAGYTFANWTEGATVVSTSASYAFTIGANRTLVANFAINTYTLTISATNGNVAKNPDQGSYNYGSAVILTATPATGYAFTGWSGDASGPTNPITVTMTGNKNITANYTTGITPTATKPSGTGSSGDPYQIASLENLYWIADQTNNNAVSFSGIYFVQTANIDASSTNTWIDQNGYISGWTTINGYPDAFAGSYDGNGHTIDKLSMNNVGLFGRISGATIKNLGVTQIDIHAGSSTAVGGIAARAENSSKILNCYVTGTITAGGGGGLVGVNDASTITNCYSTASVSSDDRAHGGLVGTNQGGSTISYSYSTGLVSGGAGTDPGGLVGNDYDSSPVIYSFWDTQSSGLGTSRGGDGKTTVEMKTLSTFTNAGWDFSTIWQMNGANYPELRVFGYTLTITSPNGTVAKNPDQASYNHGSAVILTATPATGYTFTGWSGDATGSTNPITVTMTGNKNITANYTINKYTIALTSANGTVAKIPDQASYDYGTTVTLTATPGPGYHFVNWTGNVTGSANPVSVSMDGNKTITANFAINTYTLTISATNGSVAKNPDQGSYNYGSAVILTATPATGYTFTGWSGDATGTTTPLTVTMNANKSITANFAANTNSIAQAYSSAIQYVLSLPDNAYKNPADQRRSQLSDMFAQSQSKYTAGNSKAAAQYLSQNVTNHLTPQGKNSQNVWVTDETARLTLLSMLNNLLDLLQRAQLPGTQSANGSLAAMVEDIPTEYGLSQNYPNPFNPSTTIGFDLPEAAKVRLAVYDMLGREVAVLADEERPAGQHSVRFDAGRLSSGMYIFRLQAGDFTQTKKLMLMK